jgi:hypothetical protein
VRGRQTAKLVRAALTAGAVLAAALAGCHQRTPQEDAQRKIHDCANEASEYLDPRWKPVQVTGVYPAPAGDVEAVITGQGGGQVGAKCAVVAGYYVHVLGDLETIQGSRPQPGQLYLPAQHRWLTGGELHARLSQMLAPRLAEYWGSKWTPDPEVVHAIPNLTGVPGTACLALQSRLEAARQLVACQVSGGGHRYWISQGLLSLELLAPPWGTPPIPPVPQRGDVSR